MTKMHDANLRDTMIRIMIWIMLAIPLHVDRLLKAGIDQTFFLDLSSPLNYLILSGIHSFRVFGMDWNE